MPCSSVQSSWPQKGSFPSLSIPLGTSLLSLTFISLIFPALGWTKKETSFPLFLPVSFLVSATWQSGSGGIDRGFWQPFLCDKDLPLVPLFLFFVSTSKWSAFNSLSSIFLRDTSAFLCWGGISWEVRPSDDGSLRIFGLNKGFNAGFL
jgi:hypothetical protein